MSIGPAAISVICSDCRCPIKPDDLKTATQTRVDRDDGSWSLQYDHGDECPQWRAVRMNDAHPNTTTLQSHR